MNKFVEGKEVVTNGAYGRIKKGCRNMEIVHGEVTLQRNISDEGDTILFL
ncbi:hypothetical protein [Vallitalea guaymasensis]|uniref:Uncharacterized protein n=1 Tax=Vallitalea guaymasensis TaxID=1185412 RepID=A0A8J8M8M8_9FIRM|nr:hypothetical protein [Vallitalea guaymasensis]QUH28243.1 hypothetical protein HYG85_04650 [Vallitalea guaymasensis]